MRKIFINLLVIAGLMQPLAAEAKVVTIGGWVSDEACGALHTEAGGAGCVRKCLRGGASVGHPEWKPQRMVVVADGSKKIWIVENPDALAGKEGQHVRITGKVQSKQKSLHVETAMTLD